MRILFTAFPATSHLYNLVPLAWALRNAGHEVRVAVHPDGAPTVARAGLTAVPVGEPLHLDALMARDAVVAGLRFDVSETPRSAEHARAVLTWYTAVLMQHTTDDRVIDDTVAFARSWRPDLVIWDALTYSGAIAARASGAAHARLLFGLDLLIRVRRYLHDASGPEPPEARDDVFAEWLAAALRGAGCAADAEAVEEVSVGQWTIDPVPPSMRLPLDVSTQPVCLPPYNGPATVPDWVDRPPARPRVCLTVGLSARQMLGDGEISVSDLIAAVAELDVELIATLTPEQTATLPRIPPNVRVVDFVPLNALLPTCSAIIHHGGIGTRQAATLNGVPQLIVPHVPWDQTLIAQHLDRLGAGLMVPAARVTPRLLGKELLRLLEDPSFAEAAERLRGDALAVPGPSELVPAIERRVARLGRRPVP